MDPLIITGLALSALGATGALAGGYKWTRNRMKARARKVRLQNHSEDHYIRRMDLSVRIETATQWTTSREEVIVSLVDELRELPGWTSSSSKYEITPSVFPKEVGRLKKVASLEPPWECYVLEFATPLSVQDELRFTVVNDVKFKEPPPGMWALFAIRRTDELTLRVVFANGVPSKIEYRAWAADEKILDRETLIPDRISHEVRKTVPNLVKNLNYGIFWE